MGIVDLESLGLRLRLPNCIRYHFDGFVNSLQRHEESLIKKYNFGKSDAITKWTQGRCRSFSHPENGLYFKDIHVYLRDDLSDSLKIFYRGHEETHALVYMSELNLLSQRMGYRGFGTLALIKALGDEDAADLGGLFALFLHYGPQEFKSRQTEAHLSRGLNLTVEIKSK